MKTLYCPDHPSLRVLKPLVRFTDGVAVVSDEDAEVLLRRSSLRVSEGPGGRETFPEVVVAVPEAEEPVATVSGGGSDVKLPARNATVATWVAFMAENGIKHDEGATKPEMRAIAEQHFSG